MNTKLVEAIANAVLYEGYLLYPYRPSSVKNRQRFNFGVLYPPSYSEAQSGSDACSMQTECLAEGSGLTAVEIRIRFRGVAAHRGRAAVGRKRCIVLDLPLRLVGFHRRRFLCGEVRAP